MSNKLNESDGTELRAMKMECTEQLPLFLRVHTRGEDEAVKGGNKPRHKWARFALAADVETTLCTKQSLNFGFYRFCELQPDDRYACQEEGIVYADDLDRHSVDLIRQYVRTKRAETAVNCPAQIRLYSRSEFVEEVFLRACDAGAVIVGGHLQFDLVRLATDYRVSRRRNTGWSLILFQYYNSKRRKWLPNTYRPRIRINPKDSRDAFISLAGGDKKRGFKRGRFLDLLTMAWGMRNRRHSLESACREWGVPGKLDHKPSGKVTRAEINYCRQDVRATVGLLNAMKAEYDRYPIQLQPEKVHSPASIAKAFLSSMSLRPPAEKY